ncbi:Alpha/Beta hydrolase protein [Jimgerdemannia flammicorona]|uniref:Alpha/Beta hydrolase protein n=1 Tax=Jimgerdemannia flammicorona TaxID=994334 RepID=A0A433D0L1_9FUNG|nr:Alpha/Beta hydrolase protein [Jimgerdemannia flammicorona]
MVLQFPLSIAYKKIFLIAPEYKKFKASFTRGVHSAVYIEYNKKLTEKFWRQLIEKLTNDTKNPPFDLDLAEFHAVLASLAYEPDEVVDYVIAMWDRNIGLTYNRFGHEGCVITMVYSVEEEFVVLAFKGTSVLNFTEWLTDFTTRKMSAKNSVLPGMVHAGFYRAFGFATRSKAIPHTQNEDTPSTKLIDKADFNVEILGVGDRPGKGNNMYKSLHVVAENSDGEYEEYEKYDGSGEDLMKAKLIYLKKIFEGKTPHLWITGHSLGAATATIFTSMLLWKKTKRGKISGFRGGVDIDSFKLHGTFTFGNPRVGDSDWKHTIEKILYPKPGQYQPKYQFWRIINANDIVCSVPPTILGSYLRQHDKSSGTPALTLNDFNHLGKPVTLGYHGNFLNWQERTIFDVLWNLLKEWVSTPLVILHGSRKEKILAILTIATLGMTGFVSDHSIGEYIKNLQIMKEKYAESQNSEEIFIAPTTDD